MGLSYRLFLLDPNDRIYRLANAKFARMLLDPASYRFQPFAGHRIRSADTTVALDGRTPVQVLRITCGILTFDDTGCLDVPTLWRRQSARVEVAVGPVLWPTKDDTNVVEAASPFIVQGDRWTLSGAWRSASERPRWENSSARACKVVVNWARVFRAVD